MSDQKPTLHYLSTGPKQPRPNWPWWADLLLAIVVVALALLVILPFFDTPPGHW